MVFCRVCKCEISYLGWAKHVRMHKEKVEKHIGHFPTWQEVLVFFGIANDLKENWVKKHRTLSDFEAKAEDVVA